MEEPVYRADWDRMLTFQGPGHLMEHALMGQEASDAGLDATLSQITVGPWNWRTSPGEREEQSSPCPFRPPSPIPTSLQFKLGRRWKRPKLSTNRKQAEGPSF